MLAAASRRAWRSFSSISLGGILLIVSLFSGKPIGHTHDNAEKAKAEYNRHDAHNTFISYLCAFTASSPLFDRARFVPKADL
jgi:hypothetical protein